MTIADQKRTENIAEYILFVWQMEDLVRAAQFSEELILQFVSEYAEDPVHMEEELDWFRNLAGKMKTEGVERKGHVSDILEVSHELSLLHHTLINILKDSTYLSLYKDAKPFISEYLQRAGGSTTSDVETCLTALYGLLVLRLKKSEISPETQEAMTSFSALMARLALEYRKMKQGEMNLKFN